MKVTVRYTSNYAKYPSESLVAMLHDRDRYIERLHLELSSAREQEKLWKTEVARLAGENRSMREALRAGAPNKTPKAPAETTRKTTTSKATALPLIYCEAFHGEEWYRCPHCGQGVEIRTVEFWWKKVRKNVYLCAHCNNEVCYKE